MRKTLLLLTFVFAYVLSFSQVQVSIGSGTGTSTYFPIYNLYDYSYSQTIYHASELTAAGAPGSSTITKIRYKPKSSISTANWDNWTIYMANTTKTGFVDESDYIPGSGLTQVFSGTISANVTANDWLEITLTSPFLWDGSSNLVIAVSDNADGWTLSSPSWSGYTAGAAGAGLYQGVYYYQDYTPIDVTGPDMSDDYGATNSIAQVQLDMTSSTACSGTPSAGTPSMDTAVCPAKAFLLKTTGATMAGGLTYQWQSKLPGDPAWTDISGATTSSYNMASGITQSTLYRLRITCTNGGATAYSDSALVKINPPSQCYCVAIYTTGCSDGDMITNFVFEDISNNSGTSCNASPSGYSNYTNLKTFLEQNNTYQANVTIGSGGSGGVAIWIDFDDDGIFSNSEKFYTATNIAASGTGTIDVVIDAAAPLGIHRMRVRQVFNTAGNLIDPCTSYTYGEAEDYLVEIIPPAACGKPTDISFSSATDSSAVVNWMAPTTSAPTSYDIYYNTTGIAPDSTTTPTSAGIVTPPYNLNGLTGNTLVYVWVRSVCGTNNKSVWAQSSFTTPCTSTTVPYTIDFEDATVPGLPPCTMRENAGTGNNWNTATQTLYGFNSKVLAYLYSTASAANAWFYTRGVQLTAGTSYRLRFEYGSNSSSYNEKLKVVMGNAPTSTAMTDLVIDLPNINNGVKKDTTIDFIAGNTGTVYFGFNVYSDANQYNLYLDNISVKLTPTCEVPSDITFGAITDSSAEVNWMPPVIGSPVSFDVYYSASPTPPTATTTPSAANVVAAPVLLDSLTANTKYYVWMRTFCGGTDYSEWTIADSFKTDCNLITDFSENFDAVAANVLPDCWSKVGNTGSAYVQNTGGFSAPKALYLYSSSTTSIATVALPGVSNLADNTHRLKFKLRANLTAGGIVEVGYVTDVTDPSSFVTLTSATAGSTTAYQDVEVIPGAIVGATHLALRHTGSPANSVLIDDVIWELLPACFEPTSVDVSNITNASADVTWQAPTMGSPVSYDLYYSLSSAAPTGTTTPSQQNIGSTSATIGSLSANTKYYVWVRTFCGGSSYSAWTAKDSFKTTCDPVVTLPWTEGFEGMTAVGNNILPDCWSFENVTGGTTTMGTTTTSDTYRNPRAGGTKYLFVRYSSEHWIYTPGFSLTAGENYDFSFYLMNKTGASGFTMDVAYGMDADVAGMQNTIVSAVPITNKDYILYKYTITAPSTGVYYFGIKASGNGTPWYLSFDDFKLAVTPTCNTPTAITFGNISSSGAQVSWTAPTVGSPVSYDLYYNTTGAAPNSSTTPSKTGLVAAPETLSGLADNTKYYVWMRTFCGGTDYSEWSVKDSFTTACNATNVPYVQDFETAVVPGMPNCTSIQNAGVGNNWITSSNPGYGFTTKVLRYTYHLTQPADAWFYTNGLNLTGGTSYRLKFDYGTNSTTYTEKLKVSYGSSADFGSMMSDIIDLSSIQGNTKRDTTVDFTAPVTGVYYLGFNVYSAANQNALFVDNISVTLTPTCDAPTAVVASNPTTNSVDLQWTAPIIGTPVYYEVYYNKTGTAPTASTTPQQTNIVTTNTSLGSLDASSTYSVWVRTFCGGTDYSNWSAVATFNTSCAPVSLPWAEGFESVSAPAANVFPNCWGIAQTGGMGTSADNSSYRGPRTGTKYAYISYDTDNGFFTPGFLLQKDSTYEFSFYVMNKYGGTGASMEVGYGTSPSAAGMTTYLKQMTVMSNTSYQEQKFTITPTATDTYYFGIHGVLDDALSTWYLSFDDFSVTRTSSVPVTISSFKAENAGSVNHVLWTTATEQNNAGFEVEKSADGNKFEKMSFVASKAEGGNSASTLHYSLTDNKPFVLGTYYRLKQLDKDGKATYSNIVFVKTGTPVRMEIVNLYPNPAKERITLLMTAPATNKVRLVVSDLSGRIVLSENRNVEAGENKLELNVNNLSSGTYMLKAICADGCESAVKKFVKE